MINLKDNVITLTEEELYKDVKDIDELDRISIKDFTKTQAKQCLINELANLNCLEQEFTSEYSLNNARKYTLMTINKVCRIHNLKIEINTKFKSIRILDLDNDTI